MSQTQFDILEDFGPKVDDSNISMKPHEGEALCENVYASIPRERKQTKILQTSLRNRKMSNSSIISN